VRVASNWLTMVQSRLPLLEKAMEATLGSPRQITLEASDQDRPEPGQVEAAATAITPPPPPPLPLGTESPQAEDLGEVQARREKLPSSESGPRPPWLADYGAASPPEAKPEPTPSPAGAMVGPEPEAKPVQQPSERQLEESTGLLADFFNGQVVAMDPQEGG